MGPLPNFLHCGVCCLYMAGCYAGGNSIPEHQGLAKLLDIGAGWGTVGRKGKPIPRTDIHTSDDGWTAGLPGWKGPDIVDFPPCGLFVSSRNRAIFWASIGLFCWHMGHSEAAAARLALVHGSPCCWACVVPPTLSLWPNTIYVPVVSVPGWPVMKWLSHLIYLIVQLSSVVDTLRWVLMCDTKIFILCAYS